MRQVDQVFERLKELLELERQADYETYKALVERLPLDERREKGLTWHPLQILKTGYTYGDRAFLIVERTKHIDLPHQFRGGKPVRLFTLQPKMRHPEKSGVAYYVQGNKMKIVLNSKELPDWLDLGLVGVDIMFDERTYVEMAKAIERVQSAKGNRLAELRSVLLGQEAPVFAPLPTDIQHPYLNPSQLAAIQQILAARHVAIVHGPPGTGKTTTLVHAIQHLTETEQTVLVTAPSNTAVDLLTERLADQGLVVVRIGNISRVDENLVRHTLEARISQHPESKNIKKVKIQAADYRRQAQRFKRNFGREEAMERRHLRKQAAELEAWAGQLEERVIDQILASAQVITCTLVGSSNKVLEKQKFRTLVIDEAAQALEPATWIPILKASRVVLAGDPFQLPPTVKSIEAQKAGFNQTMIEKCIGFMQEVSFLNTQYRMHEDIMGFSNQQFYEGTLQADHSVRHHELVHHPGASVIFIDTAGCGFEEKLNEKYQSRYNPEEFQILCEHLYQLIEPYEEGVYPSIALISPYREQVIYMEETIKEDEKLQALRLSVNTIDGFQGQERDVIYISLVRSNSKQEIGFLTDYRRMNVAMTRAKKLLVIVGDSATIGANPFYQAFLEYVERYGQYQTAWDYMQ